MRPVEIRLLINNGYYILPDPSTALLFSNHLI